MIVAKAPTRIDLAGGTLDLWPLFLLHEDALTINVAVNLFATAKIQSRNDSSIYIVSKDQKQEVRVKDSKELNVNGPLPLHARLIRYFAPTQGFDIETDSLAPMGSGLGGSSTLAVAICGALNEFTGKQLQPDNFIGIVRDIEAQVLGIPTGVQDAYAAVYGGLSGWHFDINKVQRITYPPSLSDLQNRMLLFFSGKPRNSGINNWEVFKSRIDGDSAVQNQLQTIREESYRVHQGLQNSDWDIVFQGVNQEWEARKKLAPSITTEQVEHVMRFGHERGAMAGKVCGAGGGGCLFLMMDPAHQKEIAEEAREKNLGLLDFEIAAEGLTVINES
ncbi:GHMP kinase [bacterium]|nr:GHMP kinase [bacterium]